MNIIKYKHLNLPNVTCADENVIYDALQDNLFSVEAKISYPFFSPGFYRNATKENKGKYYQNMQHLSKYYQVPVNPIFGQTK
jgi:hypothetical protein